MGIHFFASALGSSWGTVKLLEFFFLLLWNFVSRGSLNSFLLSFFSLHYLYHLFQSFFLQQIRCFYCLTWQEFFSCWNVRVLVFVKHCASESYSFPFEVHLSAQDAPKLMNSFLFFIYLYIFWHMWKIQLRKRSYWKIYEQMSFFLFNLICT